ncbi:MAG: hypothetical protein RL095_202 [Verrucomicrobiota bacterium]|jgi:hypothetical protein
MSDDPSKSCAGRGNCGSCPNKGCASTRKTVGVVLVAAGLILLSLILLKFAIQG